MDGSPYYLLCVVRCAMCDMRCAWADTKVEYGVFFQGKVI